MNTKDPVAAYFAKVPELHKRQFVQGGSGASFYFQTRLRLACELAGAAAGRLLDCTTGTGEIAGALLKSGRFSHATVVDISPAMLQHAESLLTSEIKNTQLEFICSDVFDFRPPEPRFDLILCLKLIAHVRRLGVLLSHLKSLLTPDGRIILQTTLMDHPRTRILRAVTTRSELARRGYRISWFSQRDITVACSATGLQMLEMRRYSLAIPFGNRLWRWRNFQLEQRMQNWASRHGPDALYLLGTE